LALDQIQAIIESYSSLEGGIKSDSFAENILIEAFRALKDAEAYEHLRDIAFNNKSYNIPIEDAPPAAAGAEQKQEEESQPQEVQFKKSTLGSDALGAIPIDYEHIDLFLDIVASENTYAGVRFNALKIVEKIMSERPDNEKLKEIFMAIIDSYEPSSAWKGSTETLSDFNIQDLSEYALAKFLTIATPDEKNQLLGQAKKIIDRSHINYSGFSFIEDVLVNLNSTLRSDDSRRKGTFAYNLLSSLVPLFQEQLLMEFFKEKDQELGDHDFYKKDTLGGESLRALILLTKVGNTDAQNALLGKEKKSQKNGKNIFSQEFHTASRIVSVKEEQTERPKHDIPQFYVTANMRKVLNEEGLAFHTVAGENGISAEQLAFMYGEEVSAVQSMNPAIGDDSRITTYRFAEGSTIVIPGAIVTHIVQLGKDTYHSLSQRYYGESNSSHYQRMKLHNGLSNKKYCNSLARGE